MDDSEPVPMGDPKKSAVASFMLIAAPVLAVVVGLLTHFVGGLGDTAALALGIAIWTALWWVFEPVPIPVTSLLPLAVLPLLGVLSPTQVAQAYGSPLILLLLGGFLLSKAMEHSGAHRRIALGMVSLFGAHSGRRLVLGFMAASAVLSMWISNTATTLMLLPVALAVLDATDDKARLAVPLLLGIAYAASVGGIGTPIGTPPNLIFMQVFEETTGEAISFTRWMSWALPAVVILKVISGIMGLIRLKSYTDSWRCERVLWIDSVRIRSARVPTWLTWSRCSYRYTWIIATRWRQWPS